MSDTTSHTSRPAQNPPDAAVPDLTPHPRKILLPCYSLGHHRSPYFSGRDDVLEQMDEVLLPRHPAATSAAVPPDEGNSGVVRSFSVCGMGGLGKTELAIEYTHTRKANFDAVFWINAASSQKLDLGLREMALKLGLMDQQDALHDDFEAVKGVVDEWLANPVRTKDLEAPESSPDVNWLIVLDNADEIDVVYDFWPASGRGAVLITSRNPLAKNVGRPSGIDLSPMSAHDAGLLLRKISLREPEADSIEKSSAIASRLGGLPLAVVQAAHGIRTKHLSLAEFIENYDEYLHGFLEAAVPGLTKQQTVALTWNIDGLPEPARVLLRVLSVLDADGITEDILTKGADSVELPNYPSTRVAYFAAREELIKSSLVVRNIDQGSLKVHRLVQDLVRKKMQPPELQAVCNAAVSLVSAVWPFVNVSNLNSVERLRKVRKYATQVVMLRSVLREYPDLKPRLKAAALFNGMAYQEGDDIKTLPIAYNEYGMALMRVPDEEEAKKSWVISCEMFDQAAKPGELPFPYPWVHRSLVAAFAGDPDAGSKLLSPILEAREKKLGKDETKETQ